MVALALDEEPYTFPIALSLKRFGDRRVEFRVAKVYENGELKEIPLIYYIGLPDTQEHCKDVAPNVEEALKKMVKMLRLLLLDDDKVFESSTSSPYSQILICNKKEGLWTHSAKWTARMQWGKDNIELCQATFYFPSPAVRKELNDGLIAYYESLYKREKNIPGGLNDFLDRSKN